MNIFEQASRQKLRFNTTVGVLNTEDLWNTSLTVLDQLFIELRSTTKDKTDSLLSENEVDATVSLSMDLIKYVVTVRMQEKALQQQESDKKQKREFILSLIAEQESQELRNKSIEDLRKMIDEL